MAEEPEVEDPFSPGAAVWAADELDGYVPGEVVAQTAENEWQIGVLEKSENKSGAGGKSTSAFHPSNTSTVLFAVNPYKSVEKLYTEEQKAKYRRLATLHAQLSDGDQRP
eukprot:g6182.t1